MTEENSLPTLLLLPGLDGTGRLFAPFVTHESLCDPRPSHPAPVYSRLPPRRRGTRTGRTADPHRTRWRPLMVSCSALRPEPPALPATL
jgi:hypothetical protein